MANSNFLLDEVSDPEIQTSLAPVGRTEDLDETLSAIGSVRTQGVGALTSTGRRFHLLREHGKGGLGAVFVARDDELHREVALKQIQERYSADPDCRIRFVAEAEITGGLEHPGVVPVYGFGNDERGRPYYAMRFIRGESFKEAIDRYHRERNAKRETGEGSLELRKLLARFNDVCEAIAYAHSRGVVHRDLKPANIMLGRYGETLVVDWGLAKAVGRDDVATRANPGEMTLRPSSGSDVAVTASGTALGTPSFMSPEQAARQPEEVGPASDVYGLGATLYYLLTGRKPFEGQALEPLLRAVQRGAFPPPRQVDRSIPPALNAICLKAMARHPADRYESPQALAEDIERWTADETVTAWREPLTRRALRWARRHRTAVTATLAGLVVALAASVAIAALQSFAAQRERTLAEREREAKNLALKRLDQIEKANELLGSVFQDLDPRAEEKDGKPLRAILGERLKEAARSLDGDTIGDPLAVASLQHILGSSQRSLRNTAEAITLLTHAYQTREARLGASDPETLRSRNALANAYADAGRTDDAIKMHEATLKLYEATLGADHQDTLICQSNLANSYQDAGRTDEAIRIGEAALRTMEATLGPSHRDTLTCRNNLAVDYWSAGRTDLAIRMDEATLKAQEAALGPNHPETLLARNNLALAYWSTGRRNEATQLHEATLRGQEATLGPNHPETLLSRHNLAADYLSLGRTDEAIRMDEETLKAREATLGPTHPDTLGSRNSLAADYEAAGQMSKAIDLYEATLKARKAALGPKHPETLVSQNNLAFAYSSVGRLSEAIALHEATLEARATTLGPNHPDTLASRNNLGIAYSSAGRTEEAITVYEATLKAMEQKLGPGHPNTLKCSNNLAVAYLAVGRYNEAIALFQATIKAQEKAYGADHPDTLKFRYSLAECYRSAGRTDEANTLQEATLKAMEQKLGRDHPMTLTCRDKLAVAYLAAGRVDEAIRMHVATLDSREATLGANHPDTITSRGNLAMAYEAAGLFAKEEPLLRENVERARQQFGPTDSRTGGAMAYYGLCLIRLKKWPEAETVLRECLSLREAADPSVWTTFNTRSMLGATLLEQRRFAAAEPLLISGYVGIKARETTVPTTHLTVRLSQAADRVLRLYELWGKPDQEAEWNVTLGLPDLPADVFSRP